MNHMGFGVWGAPGSRSQVGGVMLVLRTFPELVGSSAQNLVEIMVWRFGCEKGTSVQTVTFIYIYIDETIFFKKNPPFAMSKTLNCCICPSEAFPEILPHPTLFSPSLLIFLFFYFSKRSQSNFCL